MLEQAIELVEGKEHSTNKRGNTSTDKQQDALPQDKGSTTTAELASGDADAAAGAATAAGGAGAGAGAGDDAEADKQQVAVRNTDTTIVSRGAVVGALWRLIKAVLERVAGLHALVLPMQKLQVRVRGRYSKLLPGELLSLLSTAAAHPLHHHHDRRGLLEDLQMQVLVGVDSATLKARKLYALLFTFSPASLSPARAWRAMVPSWPFGGSTQSLEGMSVRAVPLSSYPLLTLPSRQRDTPGAPVHSASLIGGMCGYPVEVLDVPTADGYSL